MNALETFIKEKGLTKVTGKVLDLTKKVDKSIVGSYTRVLCNTTTGQSIFIKYFNKHNNFQISVNPTQWEDNGFYVTETDSDWVVNPDFQSSIDNFVKKGPTLKRGPITV